MTRTEVISFLNTKLRFVMHCISWRNNKFLHSQKLQSLVFQLFIIAVKKVLLRNIAGVAYSAHLIHVIVEQKTFLSFHILHLQL
jgi:hypothetical protein